MSRRMVAAGTILPSRSVRECREVRVRWTDGALVHNTAAIYTNVQISRACFPLLPETLDRSFATIARHAGVSR